MDDSQTTSLEQIRAFLAGSSEVRFAAQGRDEVLSVCFTKLTVWQAVSLSKSG